MNKTERQQKILELINDTSSQQDLLSTRDLAQNLNISETTIRRDFQELADAGLILRQHGGALPQKQRTRANIRGEIGVLLVSRMDRYSDPFFNEVLEGADQRLTELGYRTAYVKTYYHVATVPQTKALLESNPVDGILMLGTHKFAESVTYLRQHIEHLVTTVHSIGREYDLITFDGFDGMQMVTQHLIRLGHQRIGFITGYKDFRYQGFMQAIHENGLDDDPTLHVEIKAGLDGWLPEMGEQGAAQLMALKTPPTAIACASDRIAVGVMQWLLKNGHRVPEDIAVTGFDNIQESAFTFPPLTTVHVHKAYMGKLAAERIVQRIEDPDEISLQITTPTSLIVRQSCGGQADE
ncbi:DeoR/GlpR family transcriptional regulator [Phototrophicus methaneseepsis]|uniref:DeoR/GlpR family transcriptional regulator n=1 Tax=Phototrophicus methaneseepsis TaxID=2710758 RepID=A0A7S8ECT8_9CHLR|nr:substrate-binding domain-containing protein [Phototrophicus methaneseepsis]QPC84581.1 DeoR/GlpR family transcriptional regulator [Phototrophicus methaneseepsis]